MEEEIWKDVPTYEDKYEASSLGRIRNKLSGKILKQTNHTRGYLMVGLNHDTVLSHVVIAMTFLGYIRNGRSSGIVVNHKDENKQNNNLDNLEVITPRKNVSHSLNYDTKESKYQGVMPMPNKNSISYKSKIDISGKTYHLGTYKTEELASEIYQNALKAIEENTFDIYFSSLNIPKRKNMNGFTKKGRAKKVTQLDLDGNFINEFESISKAAKNLGLTCITIRRVLSGELNTAGGFKWV